MRVKTIFVYIQFPLFVWKYQKETNAPLEIKHPDLFTYAGGEIGRYQLILFLVLSFLTRTHASLLYFTKLTFYHGASFFSRG